MKIKTHNPFRGVVLDTRIGQPLTTPAYAARRKVYESRRWRERVRPAKLQRDPLCQRCRFLGLVKTASEIDHWQSLERGGSAWDERNLVSLCREHHIEKGALERDGRPLFEIAPSRERDYGLR